MVSSSIVKRIGRNTFDTFTFSCTILNQPIVKLNRSQTKTVLELVPTNIDVDVAEVMPLILESYPKFTGGKNLHILYLGEFNPTGELIRKEFDVFLILCVHRVTRLTPI
jgi:hypothetical protein